MVTSSSIYLFLSSSSLLFSLRTSEANYLHESFGFYSAIRSRSYYSQASKEEKFVYSIVSFGVVLKERNILRSKMAIDQSFSSHAFLYRWAQWNEKANPKLGRELGRVSNCNQSINRHHHVKDHVEISHLTKFHAFRVTRDQVIDLETWFKIDTNFSYVEKASPETI